ncbi:MAG: hypothetical protein KF749_03950 [Bacteroidetes bacterium]|nr:hypothetical protein [Bacteroidota bacterium]MCW5897478.1 hypothetical protein [Bacteroidota bacterium]
MSRQNFKQSRRTLLLSFGGVLVISVTAGIMFFHTANREGPAVTSIPDLQTAVRQSLAGHNIDLKSVRIRRVGSNNGTFSRTEMRVAVPSTFSTLNFNYDLSRAVVPFGATVVATERSEDKSVTMHIKKDGVIHQSIVFTIKQETQ